MEVKQRVLITILLGIFLVLGFYLITNAITKHTGYFIKNTNIKTDQEKCISEQSITLYVNTGNTKETLYKIQAKQQLKNIKIKNCYLDKTECENQEIKTFPTWMINNEKIQRDITEQELIKISGCESII